MDDYNFYILSGDTIVAKWENNQLEIINEQLLPLYLKHVANAELWLETRAIDSHRSNSRLLKKALRLKERDDLTTVIKVNAVTITDNYWIKPLDSDLTYQDVRFTDDYFSVLALDGKWWMYKSATHDELFSELFIYHLGKELGMNMAIYKRGDKCIKSLDFTDNASVNFEPAFAFMGDNEDYEEVFSKLEELCPQAKTNFVRMIFLDTIVANPDRHTANFGLLRDIKTGKLIGFAPLFDHNMALIARGYPKAPTKNDILISLFNDFISNHSKYKDQLPIITETLLQTVLKTVNMKVRSKKIVELIMKRYAMILK